MSKKNLSQSITDAWKTAVETGQQLDENKQKREQEVSKVFDSARNNVLHHIQENDHGFYRPDIDPLFGSVDGGMLRKQRLMEQEGVTQEDKPPVEGTPDNTEGIFIDDVEPDPPGFTGGGSPSLDNVPPGGPGREDEEPEPEFEGGGSPSIENVPPGGPGREDETEDDGTGTDDGVKKMSAECKRFCSRMRSKVSQLIMARARAKTARRSASIPGANYKRIIGRGRGGQGGKREKYYHYRAEKKAVALENAVDMLIAEMEQVKEDQRLAGCPDCGIKLPDLTRSTDETETTAPVTGATETETEPDVFDGGEVLGGDGTETGPPLPDDGGRAPRPEDRPIGDPQGPPTLASKFGGFLERTDMAIEDFENMTADAIISLVNESGFFTVDEQGAVKDALKFMVNPIGTLTRAHVDKFMELIGQTSNRGPSDIPAGPGTSSDDVTSATDSSRPEVPAGVYPFEDENYRKWYATLSDDQKMSERKRIDKEFSNRGGGTDSAVPGSPDTAPTNIQVSNTQATEIENLNREVERLNNTGALAQPGDPNYDPEFAALGDTRVTDIGDSPLGSGIRSVLGMGNAPSAGSQRQKEYLDNKRAELQQRRDEIIQRVADENNISLERAREFLGLTGDDQPLDGSIRVPGGSGDGTTATPPTSVASAATQPSAAPPRRRQGTVMASYNPVSKYGVNLFEARRKFK